MNNKVTIVFQDNYLGSYNLYSLACIQIVVVPSHIMINQTQQQGSLTLQLSCQQSLSLTSFSTRIMHLQGLILQSLQNRLPDGVLRCRTESCTVTDVACLALLHVMYGYAFLSGISKQAWAEQGCRRVRRLSNRRCPNTLGSEATGDVQTPSDNAPLLEI